MRIALGRRHLTRQWLLRTTVITCAIVLPMGMLVDRHGPGGEWAQAATALVLGMAIALVIHLCRALRVPVCTWCAASPDDCPGDQFGATFTIKITTEEQDDDPLHH